MGKTFPGYMRQEDTASRLHKTVCFYENKPVYVTVDLNFPCNTVQIVPLVQKRGEQAQNISVSDPLFSFVPPRLGFMNFERNTSFVSKKPMRSNKQGLHPECLDGIASLVNYYGNDGVRQKPFVDMLQNIYPSFRDSTKRSLDLEGSVAFSRDFAIDGSDPRLVKLKHIKRTLGVVNTTSYKVSLLDHPRDYRLFCKPLSTHGVEV